MRLPLPGFQNDSAVDFAEAWSTLYSWNTAAYDAHIQLGKDLRRENIEALLRWKAGSRFGSAADRLTRTVNLEALNQFRRAQAVDNETLTAFFEREIKPLTSTPTAIIWGIALCHFARPGDVPLFDVNVWRAWRFAVGDSRQSIINLRPIKFYGCLEYRSWFLTLVEHGLESRKLDQALMAFGQFLSSRWGQLLP